MARAERVFERTATTQGYQGWEARVPLGDGRRKSFYAPTEAEVRAKVKAWRRYGGERGEATRRAERTVDAKPGAPAASVAAKRSATEDLAGPWFTAWAAAHHPRWSERRYRDVEGIVRNHIAEPWAATPMADIRMQDVKDLLGLIAKATGRSRGGTTLPSAATGPAEALPPGRPASSRHDPKHLATQVKVKNVLRTGFGHWGADDSTRGNPATFRLDGPVLRPFRILSDGEWRDLLAVCVGDASPLATCIALMLETGIRSEESRALPWRNVDLRGQRIHIRRRVISTLKKRTGARLQLVDDAKTAAGSRTIPLPPVSCALLSKLREAEVAQASEAWMERAKQAGERFRLKDVPSPDELLGRDTLIWSTQVGTPLDPSAVRKVFDRLLLECGIATHCQSCRISLRSPWAECDTCAGQNRMITPHDLRHSCASTLMARGVNPTTILAWMGWSKISMLDRYAHAATEAGKQAAATLATVSGSLEELAAQGAAIRENGEVDDIPFEMEEPDRHMKGRGS